MAEETTKHRRQKTWLTAGIAAAVVGVVAAGVFAVVWFRRTAGSCGVVRFYEQAYGVGVLGAWCVGMGVSASLAAVGRRRNLRMVAAGSLVAVLASLAMVLVCAKTIRGILDADYSLRSTEQLLNFLAGDDLDARTLAAHALGERRAAEAIPRLCAILDDAQADINLRHNAALALGKICAPPRPQGIDLDRAVASLVGAIKSRDEYLPCSIAEALGRIGDARAVAALGDFLTDNSRPSHAREDAARALGKIGGQEARTAMERARDASNDDPLRHSIDAVLRMMEDTKEHQ
jgi:HEAT repeat protein